MTQQGALFFRLICFLVRKTYLLPLLSKENARQDFKKPEKCFGGLSEAGCWDSFSCVLLRRFDLRPRGRAPDAQLVLARRDEMIAIGSEGQLRDRFFVPLERRYLLVRGNIPDRNAPIAASGGEPATVSGKRNAAGPRSRTEHEGILVASPDIPKANGCFGGEKRLSIG